MGTIDSEDSDTLSLMGLRVRPAINGTLYVEYEGITIGRLVPHGTAFMPWHGETPLTPTVDPFFAVLDVLAAHDPGLVEPGDYE